MYPDAFPDSLVPPPMGQVAFVVLAHMSFILAWSQGRAEVSAPGTHRSDALLAHLPYEAMGSWSVWGQNHVHGLFQRLHDGDEDMWMVSIRISRHQGQHVLVVYARTLGADERRFYEDYIIRAIGITGGGGTCGAKVQVIICSLTLEGFSHSLRESLGLQKPVLHGPFVWG